MTTIQDKVRRGFALLDAKGPPNWRTKINLHKLDMRNRCLCILGQLYGDYFKGKEALGIADAAEYGFITDYGSNHVLIFVVRKALTALMTTSAPPRPVTRTQPPLDDDPEQCDSMSEGERCILPAGHDGRHLCGRCGWTWSH